MATVTMGAQDQLWLAMDRPNNLMVVEGALLLDGIPKESAVQSVMQDLVERHPVFGRKAVSIDGKWSWSDDSDFRVADHISWEKFSKPVTRRYIQDFLADKRSEPLSREKPLWQIHMIAPVEISDGVVGAAMVARFHHAIADGVRLTQVMLSLCEGGTQVPGTGKTRSSRNAMSVAKRAELLADTATTGLRQGIAELETAARKPTQTFSGLPERFLSAGLRGVTEGIEMLKHPDRTLDRLEEIGAGNFRGTNNIGTVSKLLFTTAPETAWSGEPGIDKAVAWTEPVPLREIADTGRALGGTVNDVLLAAVAGGVNAYLESHNATVEEITWMVPVNVKPFEDNLPPELGNHFALVMLPMPLTADAGLDRVDQLHQRMSRIKHSDEAALTFTLQQIISSSPGPVAAGLTSFFADKAVGVLTNVPGPQAPMTFAGTKVSQVVGFAPCTGNQPMTVAIFSYDGGVTLGLATDKKLLPEPDVLAQHILDELETLREEAEILGAEE